MGADGGEGDLNSIKISTNLPKLVLMILYPIQPKIILTDTRESQCCDDESFPFLLRLIHLRIRSATELCLYLRGLDSNPAASRIFFRRLFCSS